MIQEPFVKVHTIDYSSLGGGIPDELVCGMVVNSDCGPVEMSRVENQQDFINRYMVNNQLTTTDDTTVVHAMKMLQFTPIYLIRAFDSSIYGGRTNNDEVIYTDKNFNVMTNYKKIQFKNNYTSFNLVYIGFEHDGLRYLFCAGGDATQVPEELIDEDTDKRIANDLSDRYLASNVIIIPGVASFASLLKYLNQYLPNYQIDSILSIQDKDGKEFITIPSTSPIIDAGYSLSGETIIKLQIASNFANSQYIQFSFNIDNNSKFDAGQYFSINGFTYYPYTINDNHLYPFISTPIKFYNSENRTDKLLAYMTDLQYAEDKSIEPSLLYMNTEVRVDFNSDITDIDIKINNLKIGYSTDASEEFPNRYKFYLTSGSTKAENASIIITYNLSGVNKAICIYNGIKPESIKAKDETVVLESNITYHCPTTINESTNELIYDLNSDAKFLVRLSELNQDYYRIDSVSGSTGTLVKVTEVNPTYTFKLDSDNTSTINTIQDLPDNSVIKFDLETPKYMKLVKGYVLSSGEASNWLRIPEGSFGTGTSIRNTEVTYIKSLSYDLVNGDLIKNNWAPIVKDSLDGDITLATGEYEYSIENGTLYVESKSDPSDNYESNSGEITIDGITYSWISDASAPSFTITRDPTYYTVSSTGVLTEAPGNHLVSDIRWSTTLASDAQLESLTITLTGNTGLHLGSDDENSYVLDGGTISNLLLNTSETYYTYLDTSTSTIPETYNPVITLAVNDIVILGSSNYTSVISSTGKAKLIYPKGYYSSSSIVEITDAPIYAEGPTPPGPISTYSFADDSSILDNIKYTNVQLEIGDISNRYIFYVGTYRTDDPDATPVRVNSEKLTFIQLVRMFRKYVGDYFKLIYSTNGFTLMTDDPESFGEVIIKGIDYEPIEDTNNEGILDSAKFAVINKSPSKKKDLWFGITRDSNDPELWKFEFHRTTKNDNEDYTISFIPNKIDGYGNNVYYSNVNDMNPYIHIVELNGSSITNMTSSLFGNEVPIVEPESDDYASAVQKFAEDSNIYFDFIFDGGYANLQYAKAIFDTCADIYAEGVLTPPDTSNYRVLLKYRDNLGIDSDDGWRCILRGNLIKDSTVGDFLNYISPGAVWMEKIYNNKSAGKEFAPVFGAYNSTISYEAKNWFTNKAIREQLLSSEIPVLINDKSLNRNYFNLDTTLRKIDSYLASANNCRMVNIGAHICDNALKMYIGRFNNAPTRLEVTNELTRLLTARLISNQQYALHAIKVVCDETNNTAAILKARQLVVDIYYQFESEIRYVHVYQKIINIDEDINSVSY